MDKYGKQKMECCKRRYNFLFLLLLIITLSSCTVSPPTTETSADDINQALSNGIKNNEQLQQQDEKGLSDNLVNDLMPNISVTVPKKAKGEQRFDIAVNNAPANAFFTSLAKDSTDNIVISPAVKGNITLHLTNVTMQQVMDAVQDIYGYQYEQTSYGYNIYPVRLETQTFHVSYLNINRTGQSQTSISSGQITNSMGSSSSLTNTSTSSSSNTVQASTVNTETINNFWGELSNTLNTIVGVDENETEDDNSTESTRTNNRSSGGIGSVFANAISGGNRATSNTETSANNTGSMDADNTNASAATAEDGRSVVINPQAGLVVIKAYPYQLRQVANYLKQVQEIMNRQVIIDAKILEVRLSAAYQSGIDWSLFGNGISQSGTSSLNDALQSFTSTFAASATLGSTFTGLIELLQSQGKVNVISSPRIATVNNQKAIIKVGTDRFYITNVSVTTNTATGTTGDTVAEDVELTPFFSGVALDVTPEIDKKGEVTLHIHPIISNVTETDIDYTLNDTSNSLPSAQSTIRESDNIVRVKNRQIVIIGGLMEELNSKQNGQTPFLSRIPGLGWFFQNHQNQSEKAEIVILLKPTVMNDKAWNEQLKEASEHYREMSKEFTFKTTVYDPTKKDEAAEDAPSSEDKATIAGSDSKAVNQNEDQNKNQSNINENIPPPSKEVINDLS